MAWIRAANIAERMSDLRDAMGWDQADVANLVDRTWQTVSDWERRVRPTPRKVLARLAREQGWPITIFTEGGPMPASVVNSAVIKPEEQGSGSGKPQPGHDPQREVGAMLAAKILEGGAKYAHKQLDAGDLEGAMKTLWRIIKTAQRELRGDGMEGNGPVPEPAPDPRRPRVAPTDLTERVEGIDAATEEDDQEGEG